MANTGGSTTATASPARPGNELIIDLDAEAIQVGDWWMSVFDPSVDEVLDTYLDMVQALRRVGPHEPLPLREADLATLAVSFEQTPIEVRAQLAKRIVAGRRRRTRVRRGLVAMAIVACLTAVVSMAIAAPSPQRQSRIAQPLARSVAGSAGEPAGSGLPGQQVNRIDEVAGKRLTAGELDAPEPAVTAARQRGIEAHIDWDFRNALDGWVVSYASADDHWWGLSNSVDRTVTLFDRSGTSEAEAAAVLAHELGHAFDLEFLDDRTRQQWLELREMPTIWWVGDGESDFTVGAGDFAEAVAAVVASSPSRSAYGDFDESELAFVQALLGLD